MVFFPSFVSPLNLSRAAKKPRKSLCPRAFKASIGNGAASTENYDPSQEYHFDEFSLPANVLKWRRPQHGEPKGGDDTVADERTTRVSNSFVNTFRMSSPYIHAYHGLTFVIHIPGFLLDEDLFDKVLQDVALMRTIGIKPVLVLGPSAQIEARLKQLGIESNIINGTRITDEETLQVIKEAAGSMRFEVEGILARGVVNMPSASRVTVVSGSFYSAKPIGIIDGVDYGYTGKVRRIDSEGINRRLDQGDIIIIPNVGFSPSGQLFNCQSEEVAGECAAQLKSSKLIFLSGNNAIYDTRNNRSVPNMTYEMASQFLESHEGHIPNSFRLALMYSLFALRKGVLRAHILNRFVDGVLLMEVFHRDGVGLMISTQGDNDNYEGIRRAQIKDVMGMMEIIDPLIEEGILKKRESVSIEAEISDYTVITRDGMIIACFSLRTMESDDKNIRWAELGCFAVHRDYRKLGKGGKLMSFAEKYAQSKGVLHLFILSTQSSHFFMDKGFDEIEVNQLPKSRRDAYDHVRKPKILRKILGSHQGVSDTKDMLQKRLLT